MGKLTATDTDGFSLEEVEGSEVEEGEERLRSEEDQDCSEKQVICINPSGDIGHCLHVVNFTSLWDRQLIVGVGTVVVNCVVLQDGWSSFKEVTLKDLASDEQYDPDTVYGEAVLLHSPDVIQ